MIIAQAGRIRLFGFRGLLLGERLPMAGIVLPFTPTPRLRRWRGRQVALPRRRGGDFFNQGKLL
jgi:hypothetical protein